MEEKMRERELEGCSGTDWEPRTPERGGSRDGWVGMDLLLAEE